MPIDRSVMYPARSRPFLIPFSNLSTRLDSFQFDYLFVYLCKFASSSNVVKGFDLSISCSDRLRSFQSDLVLIVLKSDRSSTSTSIHINQTIPLLLLNLLFSFHYFILFIFILTFLISLINSF